MGWGVELGAWLRFVAMGGDEDHAALSAARLWSEAVFPLDIQYLYGVLALLNASAQGFIAWSARVARWPPPSPPLAPASVPLHFLRVCGLLVAAAVPALPPLS